MNLSFLDLLFPKRCVSCGKFGSYICKSCFAKIEFIQKPVCPVCQRQAVGGKTHPGCAGRFRLDGLVVACRYSGPVKLAIAKVKYRWVADIGQILVDLLASNIWKFDLPSEAVLVPIPLHGKRKNWRGFNQAELLANLLSKSFGVSITDAMIRIRQTKSQVGLKRDDRRENVRGAFALRPSGQKKRKPFDSAQGKIISEVKGKNIIWVDDVYTSGATMTECCKVLKKEGAGEVWGMAVALG